MFTLKIHFVSPLFKRKIYYLSTILLHYGIFRIFIRNETLENFDTRSEFFSELIIIARKSNQKKKSEE